MPGRKNHRDGELYTSHTTVTDLAGEIADHLETIPGVSKISLGRIRSRSGRSGIKSVKIIDDTGCILLEVTQNRSVQTIRVFTGDLHSTKLSIARFVADAGMDLRFGSRIPTEQ